MLLSEIIIENETDQNITISKDSWKKIQDEVELVELASKIDKPIKLN